MVWVAVTGVVVVSKRCELSIDQVITLLEFCLNTAYFGCDAVFYYHMGVASGVANLTLCGDPGVGFTKNVRCDGTAIIQRRRSLSDCMCFIKVEGAFRWGDIYAELVYNDFIEQ